MSLLISTMCYQLFDEQSTDEAYLTQRMQFLRDCGIEALDYSFDEWIDTDFKKGEVNDFWNQSLDELYVHFTPLKNAAEKAGLVFSQSHAVFPLHLSKYPEATEYLQMSVEKNIAIAAFLGCPALVVHPCFFRGDKERTQTVNLALYRRFMPFAKEYGVKICLENLYGTVNGSPIDGPCSTPEEACWYIDKLNEEAGEDVFGFCLDVGHANLLHKDLKAFVKTLGHRLTCLHLHDNNADGDLHVMPYTQQPVRSWTLRPSTDWDGLCDSLREIGYKGNLSFEAFRSLLIFPEDVRTELLQLYSSIGRYFRSRILNV